MLLDLGAQLPDLFLVVVQAVAEVLLHVTDFGLLREEVEQILDLEHVVLSNDRQRLLHFDLLLTGGGASRLVPEQMLCDLHPKLLPGLATCRLVSVVACHVRITDLQCLLDRLGVQVEDAVENDLGFLDHNHPISSTAHLSVILSFLLLGLLVFNFTLTDVDSVVDLEEDRLTLLLVSLFALQMVDQVLQVVALYEHVEGHVVNGFGCRAPLADAILSQVVTSFFISPVRNLIHGWHKRLWRDVSEAIRSQRLQGVPR